MIKDKSYSAYIIPVRIQDGKAQVALLNYGENNYGPIGGRLDNDEDFETALKRELTEELGENALCILDLITEVPTPYSFRHSTPVIQLGKTTPALSSGTWRSPPS